jgi:hypothetical protein
MKEKKASQVYTQSSLGLQMILKIGIPTMEDADIFEKQNQHNWTIHDFLGYGYGIWMP